MTKQADLIAYLFDAGQQSNDAALSNELTQWMELSSRFIVFVETYRDKIRKKIRVTREPESKLDLRSELEVAYLLLNDRRLAVTYEPYASEKRRGPDFSVTYRANLVFNIEVARIRGEGSDPADGPGRPQVDTALIQDNAVRIRKEERILRILLDKLGQMQPGMANVLAINTPEILARITDLRGLMQETKTRVEVKDPSFYTISRYTSPAAFYKDFLHLSGIILWAAAPATTPAGQLWVNKQARPVLEEKILRQVSLALGAQAQLPGPSAT